MSTDNDAILLESVTTHRARLRAAFLFGELDERRTVNDNVKRMIAGVVLAAVACAACIGVSFVVDLLAKQAAQQQQHEQVVVPGGSQ